MKRTDEQQAIVEAAVAGNNLVVKAFAGTGKTSTLIEVAKELNKPSLYVAFNKSIAEEASGKFPSSVICKTIHSLAWGEVIKNTRSPMARKLQNFFNYDDITVPALPEDMILEYRLDIVKHIKGFCQSAYSTLQDYLVAIPEDEEVSDTKKAYIDLFWNSCIDAGNPTKITPDIYLKLYQLGKPALPYSVIYLDEAQDSNPVTLSIVLQQKHAQIILVGDTYQSIYEWRGAVNAFEYVPKSFKEFYLTESFRFTPAIADIATKLTAIVGNERAIIGKGTSTVVKDRAILVRTNATMLSLLMEAAKEGKKVFVLADLKELWGKLYHISALASKQTPRFPDKELSQYKSYIQLMEAAESLPELQKLVNACTKLSTGGLTNNINSIKDIIVDKPENADFTISTIHKSKGLEWDRVELAEDVLAVKEGGDIKEALFKPQVINQLYVAVTRAKVEVILSSTVLDVIRDWETYKADFKFGMVY